MIAKLAPAFRRWTDRAKNVALLGAIAAGCVYGYAFAVAPTVDADRDFVGSVNVTALVNTPSHPLYTVPEGRQYTLTDVVISNTNSTGVVTPYITVSNSVSCSGATIRLQPVPVAAQEVLHLPLVTGFGFGAGKTVCVVNGFDLYVTFRGYLSNAVPG